MSATTEPLISLPCTTQELLNALHAVCDYDGLWGAEVRLVLKKPEHVWYLEVNVETKGEAR